MNDTSVESVALSSDAAGVAHYIHTTCGPQAQRLITGLAILAFRSAAERETLFGEPVPVSARDRRACVKALRDRGLVVERLERRVH
jgi:hypothetical protein